LLANSKQFAKGELQGANCDSRPRTAKGELRQPAANCEKQTSAAAANEGRRLKTGGRLWWQVLFQSCKNSKTFSEYTMFQ
jgi:hypothetical protein